MVLGGGGYNPWTAARLWAGLWARLRGLEIPDPLPADAQAILARLACDLVDEEDRLARWVTAMADAPDPAPGPLSDAEVSALIAAAQARAAV